MTRRAPAREISDAVARALAEDRFGHDRTVRTLRLSSDPITVRITAQAPGVLSGMVPARLTAHRAGLTVLRAQRDGASLRPRQEVLRLRGPAPDVLGAERTILNYLMHLSGIATATHRTVRSLRRAPRPMVVLGTRKTIPGLRDMEKAAIVHGGGRPHRRDLEEEVLVKSTHLTLLPLPQALARLRASRLPSSQVEVEVRTERQAVQVARSGIRRLLVDNLSPARARAIVRRLEREGLRAPLLIELSGGITPENAVRYARVGADAVSLGALTHSPTAVPFHLELLAPGRPSL